MRILSSDRALIDLECVAFNDLKLVGEFRLKLCKGRDAAAIALNGDDRSARVEKRASQAARPRSNFINALAFKPSWNCCNSGEELPVEDEILTQRLARAQVMATNDAAQGFGRCAQGVWVRWIAFSAAIRIAAAMGRASARS